LELEVSRMGLEAASGHNGPVFISVRLRLVYISHTKLLWKFFI